MSRRSHLSALAAGAVLVLTACGSSAPATPDIATFKQTDGSQAACSAIMAALPATLNSQARIASTGSPFAAVWGNPHIVVRCGVPEPSAFDPNSSCLTVNNIDWFLEGNPPPMDGGSSKETLVVTTVYRTPALEVSVPASYGTQGPSTAMAELTDVINAHTKVTNHCL